LVHGRFLLVIPPQHLCNNLPRYVVPLQGLTAYRGTIMAEYRYCDTDVDTSIAERCRHRYGAAY